jgi:hypothetical protein
MADLLDSIEWRAVECLNANPAHGVENALKQVLSANVHAQVSAAINRA